ncbi:MAG: hypothetical protein MCS20_01625 [Candidatus Phytoplasma mali]|nr:hypothetical protein [Candidatus Phytoplasma australiense]MCG7202093.1 hypothetical protein [Candidatus Phytoplasma mali]
MYGFFSYKILFLAFFRNKKNIYFSYNIYIYIYIYNFSLTSVKSKSE